jgi:hypothetical protein
MHISINPANIQSEIGNHLTKFPLPMFFLDLKPATNNKDIFNIKYLQQCKVKFEPPKQKGNIAQCAVSAMATQKTIVI